MRKTSTCWRGGAYSWLVWAGLMLAAGVASAQSYKGPTRVDFDDRLIKGQTTKADSVYIYDRQQIEIRSLVNKGRSFRPKIIRTVFEE